MRLEYECLVLIRTLMEERERELLREVSDDTAASSATIGQDEKQSGETGLASGELIALLRDIRASTLVPDVRLNQLEALRREHEFDAMQRAIRPATASLPQVVSTRRAVGALATTVDRYHRPEDLSMPLEHES